MSSGKPILRPMDIAWEAYRAGAALGELYDHQHLNAQFRAWWLRHPQTLDSGQLKRAPRKLRGSPK